MPRQRISRTKEEIREEAIDRKQVHEDMVTIPCGKCNGTGRILWAMHVLEGVCFWCGGTGIYRELSIEKYVRRVQGQERRAHHIKINNQSRVAAKQLITQERLENPDPRLMNLIQVMEICWDNIISFGSLPRKSINPVKDGKYLAWSFIEQWVERGTLSDKQWECIEGLIEKIKNPPKASEHRGQIRERVTVEVMVKFLHCFEVNNPHGYGGTLWKTIVKFVDAEENVYVWFTTTDLDIAKCDKVVLTGTVKKHDEYKGEKQTVLTRCKMN